MTVSVLELHSVYDKMTNEYGAVGGIKIVGGTEVLGNNPTQYYFVHHKSNMTWLEIEPKPQ